MTTIRKLRQRYDRLTVVERVNLVLAAQERGDEAEVTALENRCSMADACDYEERMIRLMYAASVLVVQLLAREVLVVKRFEDLAPNVANDRALTLLLEQAAAAWHGFSAWCRDVGHDPHQVLRLAPIGADDRDPAFFVIHQQIELFERWAQDFLRNSDKVEMWRDVFAQGFRSIDIV